MAARARQPPATRGQGAADGRSPPPPPLGARVRARRLELGLTVDAAAESCGLEPRHLQSIEAGATNVTLATLLGLSRGLDVGVDALVAPLPLPLREIGTASKRASDAAPRTSRRTYAAAERDGFVDEPRLYEDALAARVRAARIARGWSQRVLAARAGLSLGLVQNVENAAKSPTVRSVVLLARALSMRPTALLDEPALTGPAKSRGRPRATRTSS